MFGVGWSEILLILVVALLVLGPAKLPEIAKGLGKGIREFRKAMNSLEDDDPPPRRAAYSQEVPERPAAPPPGTPAAPPPTVSALPPPAAVPASVEPLEPVPTAAAAPAAPRPPEGHVPESPGEGRKEG